MPTLVVVPCWRRARIWPAAAYFALASAASFRLYTLNPVAAPWAVALLALLLAIPTARLCVKKQYVFSCDPKSILREVRFLGLLLKRTPIDPMPFRWVRSRMSLLDPRDTIIELGMEHLYEALPVQTAKYAMGESSDVIATRATIAHALGILDLGHERLPK